MNLKDYILNEIKKFELSDTVKNAQKLFKKLPITHVPIISKGIFIGCLSESDIQTIENNNESISEHTHLIDFFFSNENTTILELIKLFANHDCNIMPVLSKDKEYLGYFELSDILDLFSNSPFLHNDSMVLIIEKVKKEYSVSEVCQIIESNNGKVLGIYISNENSDTIELTLKIDSEDMNEIIQSFRRYNYSVISEHKDDFYLQDLKDRSDYLQKYLNM